jgi:hypothetical protein
MKRRRQRNPGTSKLRGRTLEFGPFRATEVGNEIVFESNWTDPGEHAAFIASWIHQKPKIKEEIDHKVERAKEIIGTHDPLEILTLGALEWSFTKIRESGERDLAEDFLAEYALGLCSAIPFDKPRPSPNEDTIQKFGELLRSLSQKWQRITASSLAEVSVENSMESLSLIATSFSFQQNRASCRLRLAEALQVLCGIVWAP